MDGTFITYYRVSRAKQGIRGLGMEAQRKAVTDYLNGGDWKVIAEFEEVESGKKDDRPELMKAIRLSKETGAKLVIAKLDRLARDVHFTSGLAKAGVDFVCADMPTANTFTINIMASVAQQEREMIVARTVASLGSIKDRIETDGHYVSKAGNTITSLGLPRQFTEAERQKGIQTRQKRSNDHAAKVLPIIASMRSQGASLKAVADNLNQAGLTTPKGAQWTAMQVSRAEKRA